MAFLFLLFSEKNNILKLKRLLSQTYVWAFFSPPLYTRWYLLQRDFLLPILQKYILKTTELYGRKENENYILSNFIERGLKYEKNKSNNGIVCCDDNVSDAIYKCICR